MSRTGEIRIEIASAPTTEVQALISELDEVLSAEYRPAQRHALDLYQIFHPHMRFWIARLDGAAVGCGGVALFANFGEVKRMYVRPEFRGLGIAQALLGKIEAECRAAGLAVIRLETGNRQFAACRL